MLTHSLHPRKALINSGTKIVIRDLNKNIVIPPQEPTIENGEVTVHVNDEGRYYVTLITQSSSFTYAVDINDPANDVVPNSGGLAEAGGAYLVVSDIAPAQATMGGLPVVWFDSSPTPVIPSPPVFIDQLGTEFDTYTIPGTAGVTYRVGGTAKAAGTYAGTGTVSVDAVAKTGYVLAPSAATSWAYAFSTQSATNTIFNDTFTRANGALGTGPANTGQTWAGSTASAVIESNRLKLSSSSVHSRHLETGSLVCEALVTVNALNNVKVCPRSDSAGSGKFGASLVDRVPDPIVAFETAPATISFNNGKGTEPNGTLKSYADIPGYVLGTAMTLRTEMVGSSVTVYVNGIRVLQGTYSAAQMTTMATYDYISVSGGGYIDNLKVMV